MQHETEIKVALAMIVHSHRAVCVSAAAATLASRVGPNKAQTCAASLPITKKLRLLHEQVQQPQVF